MMAVRNIRRIKPIAWIPPIFTAAYKVTVERTDGTVDDITDIISFIIVGDNATESIGNFEFELWDPNETYAHNWTGNEILRYYKDYADTATTLRFRGRIEKPSKRGNKLNCKGRSESLKLMDITITKSYDSTECSLILKSLLDNYATDFTYTNVNASTVNLTVNWYQKPFWECIQELCTAAGFEFYVDGILDAHFFESGSVINLDEGIVHEYNLLEVDEFTPDLSQIRNRIIVYGSTVKGIQIIYTAEAKINIFEGKDYGTESSLGVKEEIIYDENLTDETQAKDYADFQLASKKDPPIVGSVTGVLLATIKPGDKMRVSSPDNNIPPANYVTTGYKDEINLEEGKTTTTVYLNKEPRKISHVLKARIEAENKGKSTSINPHEMRYTYNFLFESNTGTHNNTEIIDGVLKLKAGKTSGIWTSDTKTLTGNLAECYLILNGETLTDASVNISGNDGTDYQLIGNRQRITITEKEDRLVVEVTINNADTQIESLSLQYKFE